MKILIAYDGSECADAALDDLKNAGLPTTSKALVMSMADVILPPPAEEESDDTPTLFELESVKRARERAEQKLKEAQSLAKRASEQVKKYFPEWNVRPQALPDSPAWAIIKAADEWNPDLVVVGAQGHSVLGGRLILGSVSQRVLYEVNCSVRIARGRHGNGNSPRRLLIGVDNSPYSHAAVDAFSRRDWPRGTEVRLLSVVDTVMAIAPDTSQPHLVKWIEVGDEDNWDQLRQIFQPLADKLVSAGLDAGIMIRRGKPTNELLDEAENWGADCIFLGPKGTRGIGRLLLGSVSSAVSARAHCSVEVVRLKPNP